MTIKKIDHWEKLTVENLTPEIDNWKWLPKNWHEKNRPLQKLDTYHKFDHLKNWLFEKINSWKLDTYETDN